MLRKFNGIRARLALIPNINQGGCALAAYAMHMWLKKHMPETRSQIVFGHSDELATSALENVLAVKNNDPTSMTSCGHAWVRMNIDGKTVHIDCKRDISLSIYEHYHTVPEDYAKEAINRGLWSMRFNRLNAAKIEQVSGISMSWSMQEPIRSLQFTNPFLDFSSTRLGF